LKVDVEDIGNIFREATMPSPPRNLAQTEAVLCRRVVEAFLLSWRSRVKDVLSRRTSDPGVVNVSVGKAYLEELNKKLLPENPSYEEWGRALFSDLFSHLNVERLLVIPSQVAKALNSRVDGSLFFELAKDGFSRDLLERERKILSGSGKGVGEGEVCRLIERALRVAGEVVATSALAPKDLQRVLSEHVDEERSCLIGQKLLGFVNYLNNGHVQWAQAALSDLRGLVPAGAVIESEVEFALATMSPEDNSVWRTALRAVNPEGWEELGRSLAGSESGNLYSLFSAIKGLLVGSVSSENSR
jgi:hypothetical protein